MPKTPIDYNNTIIYKIVCKDLNVKDLYVGSTTDFRRRKYAHKSACIYCNHNEHNYPKYKIIRENGGWDNWDMIEIEKYSCKDGNESRARERFWIEELQAKLNKVIPSSSMKESTKRYKDKNREEIRAKGRQYKKDNEEKLKQSFSCECGGRYQYSDKWKHFKSQKHIKFVELLKF